MNKSYLRWAGSKSRIIDIIINNIGKVNNTFIEPFFGSGSVGINVEAKDYILSDNNYKLMITHCCVLEHPSIVIEKLENLLVLGRNNYYKIREAFNNNDLDAFDLAASFIYLNRTGFNGLYRENKKGNYNTPVGSGNIKTNNNDILNFGKIIKSHHLTYDDFHTCMNRVTEGDVVYCDPPYLPNSASNSDVKYSKHGFGISKHEELHQCCLDAQEKGAKVLVSNSNSDFINDLYKDASKIETIHSYRSISSINNRGNVKELLITFEPK